MATFDTVMDTTTAPVAATKFDTVKDTTLAPSSSSGATVTWSNGTTWERREILTFTANGWEWL